jgi:lipopolysaccharide biosynthesis regulator YciM
LIKSGKSDELLRNAIALRRTHHWGEGRKRAAIECPLGDIALRQSNLTDAYAHYDRALRMNPVSAQANVGLGKVLMMRGKLRQAIMYLKTAARIDPLNTDAHYPVGRSL